MLARLSLDQLNYLNVALMVLCLVLAFAIPLELFVFSYAFLSPLHYFSEISWLHQRQYFSPGKYDYLVLGALAIYLFFVQFVFKDLIFTVATTVALAFVYAFVRVALKNTYLQIIAMLMAMAWMFTFSEHRWFFVLFAIFMTTVIHTLVFTGSFMLHGALKRRSFSGSCL